MRTSALFFSSRYCRPKRINVAGQPVSFQISRTSREDACDEKWADDVKCMCLSRRTQLEKIEKNSGKTAKRSELDGPVRKVGGMYRSSSTASRSKVLRANELSLCLLAPVVVGASANVISGPSRPVRACFAFVLPGRWCSPFGSCGWRASERTSSHSDGAASCNEWKQSENRGAHKEDPRACVLLRLLQSELPGLVNVY